MQLAQAEMLGSLELMTALNESMDTVTATYYNQGEEKKEEREVSEEEGMEASSSGFLVGRQGSFDSCMLPEDSSGRESEDQIIEGTSFEGTVRALIIDDSLLLLKMLHREMKSVCNFEVHSCTTGTEALVKVFPNQIPMSKRSRSLSRSSSINTAEETGIERTVFK